MISTYKQTSPAHQTQMDSDMIARLDWISDRKVAQWVMLNEPNITFEHAKSIRCFIAAIERNPAIQFAAERFYLVAPSEEADRDAMITALHALLCIIRNVQHPLAPHFVDVEACGAWSTSEMDRVNELASASAMQLFLQLLPKREVKSDVHHILDIYGAMDTPRVAQDTLRPRQEKLRDALKAIPAHLKRRLQQRRRPARTSRTRRVVTLAPFASR
ncbi:hypothetical protein BD626DRAFT_24646 [Schizophyllum amplum]|uniref:Uncharacterized protein n=1 Tax=Schizophyllum amplum TaxID=97359 RepID=A0A550CZF1_9AGAR|nr:hypothetical protein BD626DRAFT_24646 [Auriculariopsis ampla]